MQPKQTLALVRCPKCRRLALVPSQAQANCLRCGLAMAKALPAVQPAK
ncbi:MAG: hypothetical protein M0031_09940 [Thermaerobacter sp.]|nr:hypothetical protein [Thermaerobacter sp.]